MIDLLFIKGFRRQAAGRIQNPIAAYCQIQYRGLVLSIICPLIVRLKVLIFLYSYFMAPMANDGIRVLLMSLP